MMGRKLTKISAALCLISASSPTFAQLNCLNLMSWKWWSNTAFEEDNTSGPGAHPETYSYAFLSAIPTFLDTVLDAGIGPNGEGKVTLISGDYGGLTAAAYVRPRSGLLHCTFVSAGYAYDANICNHTTYKADSATIMMNNSILGNRSQTLRTVAYGHEIGHMFGLDHVANYCNSFMQSPIDDFEATFDLTTFEKNWINSNY